MSELPQAPTANLNAAHAQKWILASAIVVAGMYLVRRLVEGAGVIGVGSNTNNSRTLALLGSGPPPPLETWLVAYGVSYTGLAIIALGAPELAAAFAILVMVVNVINNGATVSRDLTALQRVQMPASAATTAAQVTQLLPAPGAQVLSAQPTTNGQMVVHAPGA